MNDFNQMTSAFTNGFTILLMGAYLGGAWACLAYRQLSPWLYMTSSGFLGKVAATSLSQFSTWDSQIHGEFALIYSLFVTFVSLLSTLVLVFGLGATLIDIRRKLVLAMEPKHVRT